MTVVIVIMILLVMMLPLYKTIRRSAQGVACKTNLKSLHTGAALYIQQHGHWPQIDPKEINKPTYATQWIAALSPFGIMAKNWICPTAQLELGKPDYTKEKNARVDYVAMPFDARPGTPFLWSKMPWFAEKGNLHGDGNLMIFPDGRIEALERAGSDATSTQ
jgi:hypothetical protein